jgi:uncharacterized repeat protein (TIGR01451 family)
MKVKTAVIVAAWVLATAVATVARAQSAPGPLESRLDARKVVVEAGNERLVDAKDAKPGDVIEYVATYRNTGKEPIRDLQATLPIPAATEWLPGTARPAGALASLDGQSFAATPLKRKVKRGAQDVEEEVPLREYRALRWRLAELGAGKSVTYTARVRVVDDRVPNRPKEPAR